MSYPSLAPGENDLRRIVERVIGLMAGKMNAVTSVTLTANSATTTITDNRIGGGTYIGMMPATENAALALSVLYVSAKAKGSATLTHDSTIDTDRTFDVLLIG